MESLAESLTTWQSRPPIHWPQAASLVLTPSFPLGFLPSCQRDISLWSERTQHFIPLCPVPVSLQINAFSLNPLGSSVPSLRQVFLTHVLWGILSPQPWGPQDGAGATGISWPAVPSMGSIVHLSSEPTVFWVCHVVKRSGSSALRPSSMLPPPKSLFPTLQPEVSLPPFDASLRCLPRSFWTVLWSALYHGYLLLFYRHLSCFPPPKDWKLFENFVLI